MNIFNKFFALLLALAIMFSFYEVIGAIHNKQNTGILQISTSDKKALITIGRSNHQSTNVGSGTAHIRLAPGTYEVTATDGRLQTTKSVLIRKKQSYIVSLQLQTTFQAQQSKATAAANTLIKLLPYTGPAFEYKVDYTYKFTSSTAQPTIIITAPDTKSKNDALSWISGIGVDPSILPVEYVVVNVQSE